MRYKHKNKQHKKTRLISESVFLLLFDKLQIKSINLWHHIQHLELQNYDL